MASASEGNDRQLLLCAFKIESASGKEVENIALNMGPVPSKCP